MERARRSRWNGLCAAALLVATSVVVPLAPVAAQPSAPSGAGESEEQHVDQHLANDAFVAGSSTRAACSTSAYQGRRSLLGGEPERQTFRPSRDGLAAIDVCLTANADETFSVAIFRADDAGNPVGEPLGHAHGTARRSFGVEETRFETAVFDTDLSTTAGEHFVLQLQGEGGGQRPTNPVFAWRATCVANLLGGCGADAPTDQYPEGRATGFPAKTDFAFRTWNTGTADLTGAIVDAPRHLCRTDAGFDAVVRVTNHGNAAIRDSKASLLARVGDDGDVVELGPIDVGPLGDGSTVDLTVPIELTADALDGHDGRIQYVLEVDSSRVVTESDETNNVAELAHGKLTGCDDAEIAELDLTPTSSASQTGVTQVPLRDLPFSTMSFGEAGIESNGFRHNGFRHNGFRHNGFRHNPLLGGTLVDNGFRHNPAEGDRLAGAGATTSFLYGAPLSVLEQINLTSVDLIRDGGWPAVFAAHGDHVRATGQGSEPKDHIPTHDLSLADAVLLEPGPSPAITFAELDIADSGLAGLVWAAVATGATPLDDLPLPDGTSWCAFLGTNGLDCATHAIDPTADTLVTINLLGFDMDRVPFAAFTLDRVTLHPDSPIGRAPLYTGPEMPGFDARRTVWASVVVPTDGFGVVDCTGGLCDGGATLADVSAANAFREGARFVDLVDAMPTAVLATADLGTAILGMVHTIDSLPLESADLDSVLLGSIVQDGPRTTYELDLTADAAGASLVDPAVTVVLPPDFAIVESTAELVASDAVASLGAPAITNGLHDGFRQQTVTWSTDLHVPAGETVTLRVEAVNARTLGSHVAEAAVSGADLADGAYGAATGPTAAVTLSEHHEPDGSSDPDPSYPSLAEDSLFIGHLSGPGDIDVVTIPVPAQPGSEVRVVLSQMGGDYDLVVSGATEDAIAASGFRHNGFRHNGFRHNGFRHNDFEHNGFRHNPTIPGADDQWEANGAGRSTPQALEDVPLTTPVMIEHGVRAVGIERGDGVTETVRFVSREGESGVYHLQISGFNDASGPRPYVLRHHVVHPEQIELGACQAAPFTSNPAHRGLLPVPETIDPATNTLFLLARERFIARHGQEELDAVLAAVDQLIQTDDAIDGLVVPVGADPSVAATYSAWDADRCNPAAANDVAFAVRDVVMDYRTHADIDHIVVLGDDDQIAFTRVRDDAAIGNERAFTQAMAAEVGTTDPDGTVRDGTPLTAALAQGLFLSDLPAASSEAAEWLDAAYWLPDVAIGRLAGTPDTMVAAIEQFLAADGTLDPDVLRPSATAVTGYDHLADGATAVADALDANLVPDARRLIDEDHTRAELEAALTFGAQDRDVIVSPNGHSDHRRLLPALGNTTGDTSDLFEATDLSLPPGSAVLSIGCHFGLDRPVDDGIAIADWADAVAAGHGVLMASTAYDYGDTETIGAGERYLLTLAGKLDGTMTLGEAASATVTELHARDGGVSREVYKSYQSMVTYGLPMYRIHSDGTGAQDPPALDAVPGPSTGGLATTDITLDLRVLGDGETCQPGESCYRRMQSPNGEYFTTEGDHADVTLTDSGEPIGPRLTVDVTEVVPEGHRLHGAVVRDRTTGLDIQGFDPVYGRIALTDFGGDAEPQATGTVFPLRSVDVATDVTSQRRFLSVLPWAFRSTGIDGDGDVVGTLRLDTSLTIRLLTSAGDDFGSPTIRSWQARQQGPSVTFDVVGTAGSGGPIVGGQVAYRDVTGVWRRAVLHTTDGGTTWSGVGALPAGGGEPIEVSVSLWDALGNKAEGANKGDKVPTVNPLDLSYSLSDASNSNGWFSDSVTLQFPEGGTYERRPNADTGWEAFAGSTFEVTGDGIHRWDVRDTSSGATATGIVVPIDGSSPTLTISSPLPGHEYAHDDEIVVAYACADVGPSDMQSCSGTIDGVQQVANGASVDLAPGVHTLTVTGADHAGNTADRSVTFEVAQPPIDFVGYYWPIKNHSWNHVEFDEDGDHPNWLAPFIWRLYIDGEWQSDPALITGHTWRQVTCTNLQADAVPVAGSTEQAATSWGGHGVWTWPRYRLQGYNAVVPDTWVDTCRRFRLHLVDGSTHDAYFRITREQ